jgi:hypothetical protein
MALERIAFLPFGYLVDKFRLNLVAYAAVTKHGPREDCFPPLWIPCGQIQVNLVEFVAVTTHAPVERIAFLRGQVQGN